MNSTSPPPRYQFGFGGLLGLVVSVAFLAKAFVEMRSNGPLLVVIAGVSWIGVPILANLVLGKRKELGFSRLSRSILTIVAIHSVLMLMLSSIAFVPSWRGDKGNHWAYYLLDGPAAFAFWPIYIWGAYMFLCVVYGPYSKRSPWQSETDRRGRRLRLTLPALAGNFLISAYYVFACVFLDFTPERDTWLLVAPLGAGVCYLFCFIQTVRHLRSHSDDGPLMSGRAAGWYLAFLGSSVIVKIPLSMRYFFELAEEPPEDCFVVTACVRGHRRWVGSWYDSDLNRLVNHQLLVMWQFERCLKSNLPSCHRTIRLVYNFIGPKLARMIFFRWQADLVYVLLKPIECLAFWLVCRLGPTDRS